MTERTPQFVTAVRVLWRLGNTYQGIADQMGVTKGVIAGIAWKRQFPVRRMGRKRVT